MSVSIEPITGVIKDYAWGTPGGIDRVIGATSGTDIQAEWWFGDHPQGEATVVSSGLPLSMWLRQQGIDRLGFLLKVLTPATPLSLQVHPTTEQAEAGYDREEASGVAVDSPTRVFRDRFAKPEVVVALGGEFHALAGNAPDADVLSRISELENAGYPSELAQLWREKLAEGRGACVGWLLAGRPEAKRVVDGLGNVSHANDLLELLWGHYPGDAGCAVALMLNRVSLKPGEALFVDAGEPHAYLSGVGVELMAPSDNVVRGGLSPKHIDIDTLLEVASFDPSPPPFLSPVVHSPSWSEYAPPGLEFGLHRVDTRVTGDAVSFTVDTPAIVLCIEGDSALTLDNESRQCRRGESLVLASSHHHPVSVRVEPGGAVWLAYRR